MNTYGANANCIAIGISNSIVLMTLLQPQYHKYWRSPRGEEKKINHA